MGILLTVVLIVALFVTLDVLWCLPTRTPAFPSGLPGPTAVQALPDPEMVAFTRERLDVLAAELERLDNDPDIFAKAFRTHAARSAYQALLGDLTRVAEASRLAAVSPLPDVTIVELETAGSTGAWHEELLV